MTLEVVSNFPERLVPKYDAIRKAVIKLPALGKGMAIRIRHEGMDMTKASVIAHQFAGRRGFQIQTAREDGFLYLRIAQRRALETVEPKGLGWKHKRQRKPR